VSSDFGRGDAPGEHEGPTIRDRRRIDPLTGAVRPGGPAPADGPAGPGGSAGQPGQSGPSGAGDAEVVGLQAELAERTADLQRVQAEYLNYRRRVERDREAVRDQATASAVTALFPVLDDIGRAREHGELVGGFLAVAEAIEQALSKLGLQPFGTVGDPFDPMRHEALMHSYSDEVTETTCMQIFAPGYLLGERVLRPARVAVADPTEALPDDMMTEEPVSEGGEHSRSSASGPEQN